MSTIAHHASKMDIRQWFKKPPARAAGPLEPGGSKEEAEPPSTGVSESESVSPAAAAEPAAWLIPRNT